MKEFTEQFVLLDEYGGDGASQAINVSEWDEIWVQSLTRNSASLVLKFLGSGQENIPDFNASISKDNHYAPLATVDVDNVTVSNAGIPFTGDDKSNIYTVHNSIGLRWFGVNASSWVTGDISVKAWGVKHS